MNPTEREEQIAFRQYLDLKGLPYWRTPNETFTTSWNQKRLNKAMGTQAGIPDMFVCVAGRVVGVEMKRVKGGVVSPPQKHWIGVLNLHGLETRICKGASEAIDFIESILAQDKRLGKIKEPNKEF